MKKNKLTKTALILSKETLINLSQGLETARGADPGDGPSDYVITCIRCTTGGV